MGKIIDYQADFCLEDSKCRVTRPDILLGKELPCNCYRDKMCSFPLIKEAFLFSTFEQTLDFSVEHYLITLDVEDKFNLTYPKKSTYNCTLWLNEKQFCNFSLPCDSITGNSILEYTYRSKEDFSTLFNDKKTIIKCKILVNDNIVVCPKFLNILAFE